MAFDFDAFAGALLRLSRALDKTADMTGIPRGPLTRALHRHAIVKKKKWEARLWKSAASQKELGDWIWRERKKFDAKDDIEIFNLSDEIPARIRRNLIEIAKSIPGPHGGKPPALNFIERWQAQRRVRELHDKGLAIDKAYEKVAKRMGVSKHTVRRCCDERERDRSRGRKNGPPKRIQE